MLDNQHLHRDFLHCTRVPSSVVPPPLNSSIALPYESQMGRPLVRALLPYFGPPREGAPGSSLWVFLGESKYIILNLIGRMEGGTVITGVTESSRGLLKWKSTSMAIPLKYHTEPAGLISLEIQLLAALPLESGCSISG